MYGLGLVSSMGEQTGPLMEQSSWQKGDFSLNPNLNNTDVSFHWILGQQNVDIGLYVFIFCALETSSY